MKIALRKQICNTRDNFGNGSEVCYKRNNNIKWKEPGNALGQDGAIFKRQAGLFIKAHCLRGQSSREFAYPNITQDKSNIIKSENDEKSPKITPNAPN